ncbi:MAG: metal ABC transporter substrate-binding protein [Clostridiales bacterium]|nr:metal ABC transporter substrate-binding protein [Clostridiales bacterium]
MKKLFALILALALTVAASASAAALTPIRVGATATPHAEVLEFVRDDLAALGYDLQIVEFTEYPLPNPALAAGELEANYFQHMPYLNAYNATVPESEQLVAAFPVHYEPYGIYAGKTKALADLKEGAVVTVTNDPSNETRALMLLESAGLITLPEGTTPEDGLTVLGIVENPLKLDIREVEAATLPATLEDADIAVINGNFAMGAGLSPATDAVFLEPADGEVGKTYANYVVVRAADADADFVKALQQVLQTAKVRDFILGNEKYKGGVIPTFTVEAAQ